MRHFTKIRPVGSRFSLRADRRTDMTRLVVALRRRLQTNRNTSTTGMSSTLLFLPVFQFLFAVRFLARDMTQPSCYALMFRTNQLYLQIADSSETSVLIPPQHGITSQKTPNQTVRHFRPQLLPFAPSVTQFIHTPLATSTECPFYHVPAHRSYREVSRQTLAFCATELPC